MAQWCGTSIVRKVVYVEAHMVYWNSLYFVLHFTVNLKCAEKLSLLIWKNATTILSRQSQVIIFSSSAQNLPTLPIPIKIKFNILTITYKFYKIWSRLLLCHPSSHLLPILSCLTNWLPCYSSDGPAVPLPLSRCLFCSTGILSFQISAYTVFFDVCQSGTTHLVEEALAHHQI